MDELAAARADDGVELLIGQYADELLVLAEPARCQQPHQQRPLAGVVRLVHGHHVLALRQPVPVLVDELADVVAGERLREVGERAHHGVAGRERVVAPQYLGDFLVSGHGDDAEMRGQLDRALRSQRGQEWIRVLRHRFVGEPIARFIARHFRSDLLADGHRGAGRGWNGLSWSRPEAGTYS